MRRLAGVVVAAVVLGLIALCGIFGTLLSLMFAVFVHNPILPSYFRPFVILGDLLMLCFFLYCAWTVIDLFRIRNWARISIVVIGSLIFLFSLCAGVGMLAMRQYAPLVPQGPHPIDVSAVFVGIAGFYFLVSLIGLWWIVYFSLPHVRGAFRREWLLVTYPDTLPPGGAAALAPTAGTGTSVWRIVIVVWACLMLFSVLCMPMIVVMRTPLFLFGAVVDGPAEMLVLLLMAAAEIYTGIGLLAKWRTGWYLALLWQVYAVAYTLSFLVPGVWSHFIATQEQLAARWTSQIPMPFPVDSLYHGPFVAICFSLGAVIVLVITVALFQRKGDYLTS